MVLKNRIGLGIIAGLLFFGLLALSGCGSSEKPGKGDAKAPQAKQKISIGTAAAGGVFYPLGVGIADVLNKNLPDVDALAEETGGARANINLMEQKEIEMGMLTSDTSFPAARGEAPFTKKVDIKLGWKIFDDPVEFVTLDATGIKTIQDLKGKRLSVGTAGATSNTVAIRTLKAHGLKESDVSLLYLGWSEAADALADGQIDAFAVMGAIPVPAVDGLAARKDIELINCDPNALANEFKDSGVFVLHVPAGTYKGQDRPAYCPNPIAHVWFRGDLSEDLVYRITKTVFANLDYLKTVHKSAGGFELLKGTDSGAELVHPGVVKYAKEIGKW